MEYRDNIKSLRKEFWCVVKDYYNTNTIILKMISEAGFNKGLSKCDLAFRTCQLHGFSDKHINKLYDKDSKKAIHELRTRGMCCIYTARDIEDMLSSIVTPNKRYVDFVGDMNKLCDKLYNIADKSIQQANTWARQHDMPLLYEDGNLSVRDFKQTREEQNINDFDIQDYV